MALGVIRDWLTAEGTPELVRCVLFRPADLDAYRRALDEIPV